MAELSAEEKLALKGITPEERKIIEDMTMMRMNMMNAMKQMDKWQKDYSELNAMLLCLLCEQEDKTLRIKADTIKKTMVGAYRIWRQREEGKDGESGDLILTAKLITDA